MRDLAVSLALAMPSTEPSLTTQHCSSPSRPPVRSSVAFPPMPWSEIAVLGLPRGSSAGQGAPLNNFTTRPSGLASRVSQRCD